MMAVIDAVVAAITNATVFGTSPNASGATLSNGNRTAAHTSAQGSGVLRATTSKASATAAHYIEFIVDTAPSSTLTQIGIQTSAGSTASLSADTSGYGFTSNGNGVGTNAATTGAASNLALGAWAAGDVIGMVLKAGKLYFHRNGTYPAGWDPNAGTGGVAVTSATYFPAVGFQGNIAAQLTIAVTLTYPVPTGCAAWN